MTQAKKNISEILTLFRPTDQLAVPLATGQPMTLLNALNERTDWEDLHIFTGLLIFPYPILMAPHVSVTSGYYGPIERTLNEQGGVIDYLPADFSGFEFFAKKKQFRVVATTLSPPDADGYMTFGTHGAAVYRPFIEACRDPHRIAIAEVNTTMPVVYGHPDYGDNKIHVSELNYYFESNQIQVEVPEIVANPIEEKIADHVLSLISEGATLQFGIGAIPNIVAERLAQGKLSDFGIHTELISDSFLKLWEAGKISNRRKGIFEGQSVFTFAFGSQKLYDFLDERQGHNKRQAICLPVTIANDPHQIAKNKNMISINSGFMVDFAGQVSSEAIGLRQYSGVGGQLAFVQGAYAAPQGRNILCIKSTAMVQGKKISNILSTLPQGSMVSTPRHYVQFIVTEYGIADLYGVSDEKRPERLIQIAHPDFRTELQESYAEMKKEIYKR